MSVFKIPRFFSINSLGTCSVLCLRNTLKCDQQHMFYKKNAILQKLGIPLPPKKPLTPYLKYIQQERVKIIENNPKMTPTEAFKIMGKQWPAYNPEQKKLLQKEYLHEVETYLAELKKYKENITPEQENLIKSLKDKHKRSEEMVDEHKKRLSLGKPKKPPTFFIQFLREKQSYRPDNMKYTEWVSNMAKEWENISPSEKERYKVDAGAALEKYKTDLLNWENNMIKKGHVDIIRSKNVVDSNSPKKQSTEFTV